ncbi:unnamed protein product [Ambrosiozyma monospora]|uniref:Unnamed protein product n=1 Tax=Ambrosiozyma monospora TaxID=43982 RepID=A0ACB5STN3_AMBMO|nr:unnamed protein product [Ambrosiozyma monospora]
MKTLVESMDYLKIWCQGTTQGVISKKLVISIDLSNTKLKETKLRKRLLLLLELNNDGAIELRFGKFPKSTKCYPSYKTLSNLIDKTLFSSLPIKVPFDNTGLDNTAHLNKIIGLKKVGHKKLQYKAIERAVTIKVQEGGVFVPNRMPINDAILYSDVKSIIHSLPSGIKCFNLTNVYYLKDKKRKTVGPEYLQLNNLNVVLNTFFLSCSSPSETLDLSTLPYTRSFALLEGFHDFSGQFPSTMEDLLLVIFGYPYSFMNFWKKFIRPLKKLNTLKMHFDKSNLKIDFRDVGFPPELNTVVLNHFDYVKEFKFGKVPDSLVHFSLKTKTKNEFDRRARPIPVIVELKEGQSLESIKKKFKLDPKKGFRVVRSK